MILETCGRWVDSTALPVYIGEKSSMAFRWIAQGVRWKWYRKLEYWGSEGRTYHILFGSSIGHSRSLHFLVDVWKGLQHAARRDSVDRATKTAGVVGVNVFESPRFEIVAARKSCHWHCWRSIRIDMQRRCQIQTKFPPSPYSLVPTAVARTQPTAFNYSILSMRHRSWTSTV